VAKTRLYEIAKELDLESKAVVAAAKDMGFEVKTASSGLEEADAAKLRASLGKAQPEPELQAQPELQAERESGAESGPEPEPEVEADEAEIVELSVQEGITPIELGELLGVAGGDISAALIGMGEMVGATDPIPTEALELVGESLNAIIEVETAEDEAPQSRVNRRVIIETDEASLVQRPPVVTIMGHVDHGKTTLLDAIRSANVVEGEAGGITQHIAAYQVDVDGNAITFLDTPGHEAFTALRARGAEVTDNVVLVVAADDGIMPQTAEAISHTKAAGVPMIVAINKMDMPGADPFNVRAMLTEREVVVEALGGDVPSVEISALKGDGIDELLQVITLVAELEDLKGNPKPAATGVIVESRLDPGLGPVATVIVQRGTLKQSDALLSGAVSGRVRAMLDHNGERLKSAGPSVPALVTGWSDMPGAGEIFEVAKNEREGRKAAISAAEAIKASKHYIPTARERLAQLLENLRTSDEAELRLIVKADAAGSLEAIREAVAKITREGGSITIAHGAVGGINLNDISLAEVTESVVFGFNVRPDAKARRDAEDKGIEVRTYSIIYEMLDEIEAMLVGRLAPDKVEQVLGSAEVREVFQVPRQGNIGGSYVTEGVVQRGANARLLRAGIVIHDGIISSLRRFKDDVREVAAGFECGIGIDGYNDLKVDDVIEVYEINEVERT